MILEEIKRACRLLARASVIAENHFVYKSLSNLGLQCCSRSFARVPVLYVPSAATIKQGPKLAEYGIKHPDAHWGDYVLLRPLG